jgi:hypothetical protein
MVEASKFDSLLLKMNGRLEPNDVPGKFAPGHMESSQESQIHENSILFNHTG